MRIAIQRFSVETWGVVIDGRTRKSCELKLGVLRSAALALLWCNELSRRMSIWKPSPKELKEFILNNVNNRLGHDVKAKVMPQVEGFGGCEGIAKDLGASLVSGIKASEVQARQQAYGINYIDPAPPTSFFKFCLDALEDFTLRLLLFFATMSMVSLHCFASLHQCRFAPLEKKLLTLLHTHTNTRAHPRTSPPPLCLFLSRALSVSCVWCGIDYWIFDQARVRMLWVYRWPGNFRYCGTRGICGRCAGEREGEQVPCAL